MKHSVWISVAVCQSIVQSVGAECTRPGRLRQHLRHCDRSVWSSRRRSESYGDEPDQERVY